LSIYPNGSKHVAILAWRGVAWHGMRPGWVSRPAKALAGDAVSCLHDEGVVALGAKRVGDPLIIHRADQGVKFGAAHRDQHSALRLRSCRRHAWLEIGFSFGDLLELVS
jgi:hypothetical protein